LPGDLIQWDAGGVWRGLRDRFGGCLASCEGSVLEIEGKFAAWHAE